MKKAKRASIILLAILAVILGYNNIFASDTTTVDVFYKEKTPSQKVLKKVKPVLSQYKDSYLINYYCIEDEKNLDIIKEFGLPSTHFPFAVVIDGKFNAKVDAEEISFVHFPLFMKGIGRHEGNWSIANLEKVLMDKSLLMKENILPAIEENHTDSECEE